MCGEFYQCTLTFPPNAAFQKIVGPLSQSSHMAKQLVCLESCKKLHQLGALNDCLLPSTGESYDSDSTQHMHESAEGAGKIYSIEVASVFLFGHFSLTTLSNHQDIVD